MIVYKICYLDECENPREVFEHTEIVKAKDMADYVETMNSDGRICEENYDIFKEKHPRGCCTQQDAVELLELDGYSVEKQTI